MGLTKSAQVAYLMADISNVNLDQIKELYASLESLSCESCESGFCSDIILTHNSSYYDAGTLLKVIIPPDICYGPFSNTLPCTICAIEEVGAFGWL